MAMEKQQQTNWCWSAVAVSVAKHYDTASPWTQCRLVSRWTGKGDCCTNGASKDCNVEGYIDWALATTKNYATTALSAVPPAKLLKELHNRRPVCCRVVW